MKRPQLLTGLRLFAAPNLFHAALQRDSLPPLNGKQVVQIEKNS